MSKKAAAPAMHRGYAVLPAATPTRWRRVQHVPGPDATKGPAWGGSGPFAHIEAQSEGGSVASLVSWCLLLNPLPRYLSNSFQR